MTLTMYPPQVNSPQTSLVAGINAVQTSITVFDGNLLPAAPNILVLGDGNDAETILYTSKVGNELSGITRGFQGTARAFAPGTNVARYFTAYDQEAIQENISGHVGDTGNPHGVTAAQVGATPAAHATDVSNPHSVTAAQVGLGSVQNYGIATQVEAEAGVSNVKHMTPLRTKQSIEAETTTVGAANKIVKTDSSGTITSAGDIISGSGIIKLGGYYLRFNNGTLEKSADLVNWKVVGGLEVAASKKVVGQTHTSSGTFTVAHSYTGSGVLRSLSQFIAMSTDSDCRGYIRVTIDGSVVIDETSLSDGYFYTNRALSVGSNLSDLNIRFNTSLLIEHRQVNGGVPLTCWNYDID